MDDEASTLSGGTGGAAMDDDSPPAAGGAEVAQDTPDIPQGGMESTAGGMDSVVDGSGGDDVAAGGADEPDEPDEPAAECDLAVEGEGADLFSSFVISYEALQREAEEQGLPNPELGLGGNLGGLEGADAICQRAAEYSTPCAANKTWRAFLSTTTVDAIDRIGTGPWYDRLGRTIALSLEDLVNERPSSIDPAIETDWPNEFGVPNQNPDNTGNVDNHEVLTGSGEDGRLYFQEGTGSYGDSDGCNDYEWSAERATCNDWTSAEEEGCPRVGHSWYMGTGLISGKHWISLWNEGGCARGVQLMQVGGVMRDNKSVGSAGGYGGFYCFAVPGEDAQ